MKYVIGIVLILGGLAAGIYVGLWVFFVGGLVQAIDAIKATPINKGDLAIGIVRMLVASTAGEIVAFFMVIGGWGIMVTKSRPMPRGGKSNRQVERDWEKFQRGL